MNRLIYNWLIHFILFALTAITVNAQQKTIVSDSLITVLSNMDDGLEKVAVYNQLAAFFSESEPDRALYFCRQALSLANKLQSGPSCAVTNKLMAEIFEYKLNYQPSINYYLISIKQFAALSDNKQLALIYNKLGNIYILNNYDYDQGMVYYKLALEHAEKVNDKKEISKAYNSIGGIYFYRNDLTNADKFFNNALKIRTEIGDPIDIAASLNNIGEIHRLKKEYSQALELYNQAIQLNEKNNHTKNLAVNFLNTGLIYSATAEIKNARTFFIKSIQLNTKANDTASLIGSLTALGNHYNSYGIYDSAISIFNQVYTLSQFKHFMEGQRDASQGLSVAFDGKGNIRKAFDNYKLYTQLKDSLFTKIKTEQLDELHTRFSLDLKEKELALKDNEIALLQREQNLSRFRQLFLWLSLLLLLIAIILIYAKLQARYRKNRIKLEHEATLSKSKQEFMEIELTNKNYELTNFAIHLVEKNKFLHELKTELKSLRNTPINDREERLKELTFNVQQNIKIQKDLEDFQNNVDQVNAAFFVKLKQKFPNLTKNEERLCAMLRLNLSSKEIASLNNISIRAVEMSRYRLRKKFNIPTNIAISDFFQEL